MHIGSDYTFMLENYNSCCHLVMILGKALGGGLLAVKSSSCRSRCYTLHSTWRTWEVRFLCVSYKIVSSLPNTNAKSNKRNKLKTFGSV